MNLHEYQAKGVLKSFGVNIQEGIAIDDASKVTETAQELTTQTGTGNVVKAQIHGTIRRGKGGGVKLAKNLDELQEHANNILGMQLIISN